MTHEQNRTHADEAAIRRLRDELLVTTDLKDWTAARALFADGPIEVDMSSLVGAARCSSCRSSSSTASGRDSIPAR
jgi:hypothetical protein